MSDSTEHKKILVELVEQLYKIILSNQIFDPSTEPTKSLCGKIEEIYVFLDSNCFEEQANLQKYGPIKQSWDDSEKTEYDGPMKLIFDELKFKTLSVLDAKYIRSVVMLQFFGHFESGKPSGEYYEMDLAIINRISALISEIEANFI